MSGKLGHSLKRNRQQVTSSTSTSNEQSPAHLEIQQESSTSEIDLKATQNQEQSPTYDDNNSNAKKRKRHTCDTPDSSSSESETAEQNHILLEALHKIIELENELELLQNDEDNNYDESDTEVSQNATTNFEAEALGFAMCARETLLFLQNEGISENSLLYQALKDKLVGSANGIPI